MTCPFWGSYIKVVETCGVIDSPFKVSPNGYYSNAVPVTEEAIDYYYVVSRDVTNEYGNPKPEHIPREGSFDFTDTVTFYVDLEVVTDPENVEWVVDDSEATGFDPQVNTFVDESYNFNILNNDNGVSGSITIECAGGGTGTYPYNSIVPDFTGVIKVTVNYHGNEFGPVVLHYTEYSCQFFSCY